MNVLEAPEGGKLPRASELTATEGITEIQPSQSTRAAKTKAIAVLVGASALGVIVTLNAIALKMEF